VVREVNGLIHRNNTQQVKNIKHVKLFDADDEGGMFL
jgi:hypothetical protein